VLGILRKTPAAELSARYGIAPGRARTLAAGTILLSEVQRRLAGIELEVARAGLREGAALALLAEATAA
jgi:exopolyphosphatase/pppGpp-phosphohydrolase